GQRGDAGPQHFHRRGLARELAQQGDHLGRQLPVGGGRERLHLRVQLLPARQPALPEEVDRLLERRMGDEVVHVVAPIEQAPPARVPPPRISSNSTRITTGAPPRSRRWPGARASAPDREFSTSAPGSVAPPACWPTGGVAGSSRASCIEGARRAASA